MAKMRRLYDQMTREPYLQEIATGRAFRRMVGALAWPFGDSGGSTIVLGESRDNGNVHGGRHHVHVLAEVRSTDVVTLFDAMAAMQDAWLVERWCLSTDDNRVWMLDDYNDERRRSRLPRLIVAAPPGLEGKGEGLIPFYHALVQRRTLNEKTLFLGKACMAGPDVARLGDKDVKAKVVEYPGAAALFFALAEIDMNPMPEWNARQQGHRGPADPLGGY